MSYAVLRGDPNPGQIYLDEVLDAVLLEREKNGFSNERTRESVSLAEILYYSMRTNPNGIHMINGATGESFTNEKLLKRAVSIARALIAKGLKGKTVIAMMRNHEHMAALFYGMLFARVVPYMVDPNATNFEVKYFMNVVSPSIVFCETDRYDDLVSIVKESFSTVLDVITINEGSALQQFIGDESDDFNNFKLSISSPESPVLMLPTSGSTGLPKATLLNNQGLVAQLPRMQHYYNQFPTPNELLLLTTTAQWATHTAAMTACPVCQFTLLVTSKKLTNDHLLELFEKFRPTFVILGPMTAASIAEVMSPHQLTSLKVVIIVGAPPTDKVLQLYTEKLPKTTHFRNGYGMTELHGCIALPDHSTDLKSIGKIINTIIYKLVDDDGKEMGSYEQGELWLKSDFLVFNGYYNNEEAYRDCVTSDGWLKTGDVFYRDENDNMHFVFRKKFNFKYSGKHISPEEIENVISSIPGVKESVVCDSGRGPAAAVVRAARGDVTRDLIHRLVDSTLSDHKRLRGGIVFVESLPHTHSGKLQRLECIEYVRKLVENGQCN